MKGQDFLDLLFEFVERLFRCTGCGVLGVEQGICLYDCVEDLLWGKVAVLLPAPDNLMLTDRFAVADATPISG